ncbi:MAG TPA: glycosyltransferase [Longimicrobiales bacterium]|nr:glycosyltransferase [Longimicrobiales bacterium]
MSDLPRVSVLMPCRDAAAHLAEALDSILAQTFADFELIAVEDGSRDGTGMLLRRYARRDDRVRVLPAAGAGIVAALRQGLAAARGEIVARMDADDVADPARLDAQLQLLDADPGLAACGTGVCYFPRAIVRDGARRYERWLNGLTDDAAIRRDLFVECPIAHPTLAARRSALEAVDGYQDHGWPEDYDLVLRLAAAGPRLGNVPAVLHHWRERPDRLSRVDPRYSEEAFRRCRLHHLRPRLDRSDGVVVWGAGPVGKGYARALRADGVPLRAFVDLDPRKIGQTIHGAPVVAPAAIDRFRGAFALAAVAGEGPRRDIRASLAAAGWREGEEFVAVA